MEAWADVVPESVHWTFRMDGLKVNGKRITGPNHAITDTGSSELFVPHSAAQQIARAVGAYSAGGAFLIKCSARFKVTLVVGGKDFDITHDQLVIPVSRSSHCLAMCAPVCGSRR